MIMKNSYGLLGGRRNIFHQDIHNIIKELAIMVQPTLVILDGTTTMMSNGPTGGSLSDLKQTNTMIVSTDQVAADAFGATLLGKNKAQLPYILKAEAAGLGTADMRHSVPLGGRRLIGSRHSSLIILEFAQRAHCLSLTACWKLHENRYCQAHQPIVFSDTFPMGFVWLALLAKSGGNCGGGRSTGFCSLILLVAIGTLLATGTIYLVWPGVSDDGTDHPSRQVLLRLGMSLWVNPSFRGLFGSES